MERGVAENELCATVERLCDLKIPAMGLGYPLDDSQPDTFPLIF